MFGIMRTVTSIRATFGAGSGTEDARAWLAAIADSSHDAIIGENLDGIVTSWNKAAESMFGFSTQEIVGQPITEIIPWDRLDEEASVLERVASSEKVFHVETMRQRKDGKVIPVSLAVSPIRDRHDKVIGAAETIRDLTKTQRIYRDLERREALLESILDTVPDALIVIDKPGLIHSFSKAAGRLFGYTSAEMIGQNISILLPAADWDQYNGGPEGYHATGEHRIHGFGQRNDGSTFPMELAVGEVNLPEARLLTAFVHDLTKKSSRERVLREADTGSEGQARQLSVVRDVVI